jgi:hypothetical protein
VPAALPQIEALEQARRQVVVTVDDQRPRMDGRPGRRRRPNGGPREIRLRRMAGGEEKKQRGAHEKLNAPRTGFASRLRKLY